MTEVTYRGMRRPEIHDGLQPTELHVEHRGIPHLAKNERDMGHGGFSLQVQHFQNRR
jgi:hypothetical protein